MSTPFQLGIDICNVRRMAQAIERGGARFLDRVFTKAEQTYCSGKRNQYEHYAARFAAKEALIKAKKGGRGRYTLRDIEIVRNSKGAPSLHIDHSARNKLGISATAIFELTMTHEREFAVAAVAMIP
ncbi:MAG: holo-[acyl-carrier-protein] synthase [Omnitrophica bacterium RIFCSPLOWO2_12_FULL_50_11]|nr:MAG: holo-[acyl-carrier-protein] synthase [Omnitrophica bacterium RIFCSPLOWO2_12_FULL_50_11]